MVNIYKRTHSREDADAAKTTLMAEITNASTATKLTSVTQLFTLIRSKNTPRDLMENCVLLQHLVEAEEDLVKM